MGSQSDNEDNSVIIEETPRKKQSSSVQVPDSSPLAASVLDSSPVSKPDGVTRLPSLRERFSYKPTTTNGNGNGNRNGISTDIFNSKPSSQEQAKKPTGALSLEFKKNFISLRNNINNQP
ncbi:unnamed protein product [[Candida] boidinii]|uniref:Unnamed protein product n=1 Tax=Candida boidinii TaxID=5477 RepID=A0A9W6T8J2_CANBO|nr:unnamed protein product [[Candida] boidinii]